MPKMGKTIQDAILAQKHARDELVRRGILVLQRSPRPLRTRDVLQELGEPLTDSTLRSFAFALGEAARAKNAQVVQWEKRRGHEAKWAHVVWTPTLPVLYGERARGAAVPLPEA